MKNNIKYIKLIGIFVLALVISAACVKWDEETNPTLESASAVTLQVFSTGDSSVVISYSNSMNGYVALNLYEGLGNEVPTDEDDREAMLTGNVVSMEYYTGQTVSGGVYQYTFEGLVQDASYEVMGVANNDDGVVSEVTVQVVHTGDSHPPMLTGTDPEVTYDPVLPVDGSVVLYFDEPILYDDTKDLTFSEFFDGEDVVAGSVVVSGNMATVSLGEDLTNRDYVWLSYPEGTFTDLSGNLVAEMVTYQDGNQFVGLYWRAEAKVFEAVSITPVEEVVPSGFDIVVSFADSVNIQNVDDGDITLTYDDGLDVLIKAVLVSDLTAVDNDLTITQSYAAPAGVKVTLNIPADLLSIGIGNPNAEVTASWIIEITLADLVGNYTVDAVSYASPGVYDEVWTATVELVPGNDTALSITIDAGVGGGVAFLAKFDVDALEVLIPAGSEAGNLYGLGSTVIYGSDGAYLGGPAVGTILSANSFNLPEIGMYLPDYDWGDGTFGALWDAFNSTWTKSATKAAAVGGGINPAKVARFK